MMREKEEEYLILWRLASCSNGTKATTSRRNEDRDAESSELVMASEQRKWELRSVVTGDGERMRRGKSMLSGERANNIGY
ncbi:hypothetical protein QYF36_011677 [Acer negundo]|nr:hypothetical protein QYF36_011677 [Acer negundo]